MFKTILDRIPPEPQTITLTDIIDNYDYYFIDLWGVMHNGQEAYPLAIKCVNSLLSLRKKVIFLSNMPRPKELVFKTMKEFGVNEGFNVITSGDCVRHYLSHEWAGKKVYHFGADVNEDITNNIDIQCVDNLDDADIVLLTTFIDGNESLTDHIELCKKISTYDILTICANPDQQAANGDIKRITAGYFAKKIEEFGGDVHYIGKPFVGIYDYAFKMIGLHQNHDKAIMIGDTLETDVLGAFNASIDSILTLGGVTRDILKQQRLSLLPYCDQNKLPYPTYIMDMLKL